MISVVICSINKIYLQALKQNIDANIGVEHECLIWDNTEARLGICEVYNKMAERSKFPYLCFVHEDVLIETPSWGKILVEVCENDTEIGLIGVAGGKYKSNFFSGWYSGGNGLDYYCLIHRKNNKDEKFFAPQHWSEQEMQVATIDGVFMFCNKTIWQSKRFNDDLLKGFHYYDIDFSLRVAWLHKVVVTNRLQLIHCTKGGDFGDKWVKETIIFHNAYKNKLPFSVVENLQKDLNTVVNKYWLDWLKNMDISLTNRFKWIYFQGLYKYLALWYSILKFVLYKPLALTKIHKIIKSKKKDF